MTGACLLAVCLVCICFIAVCAFGLALIYYYNKHKKIMEELTSYEIDINANISEEIPKILETFVESVFTDYRVKFLEPTDKFEPINDEKEQQIIREVADQCATKISPAMIHKLSLFWNPQSIGAVIADKVYLIVVAYVANHNSVDYGSISNNLVEKK